MKIIALIFLFASQIAFASGSLSLEPSYDPERGRTHVGFGLGVYEQLAEDMAYNSWTGFGDSYDAGSSYHAWYVSKHQIDFKPVKDLTFSPGVRINYLDDPDNDYQKRLFAEVFAKVAYKLW